jgi:hypothetical protein
VNAEEFLRRRKDRTCAIILTTVDREVTDRDSREHVRKVILDQINDFYNAIVDVVNSMDSGTVVLNELYLERLDQIDQIFRKVVSNGDSRGTRLGGGVL